MVGGHKCTDGLHSAAGSQTDGRPRRVDCSFGVIKASFYSTQWALFARPVGARSLAAFYGDGRAIVGWNTDWQWAARSPSSAPMHWRTMQKECTQSEQFVHLRVSLASISQWSKLEPCCSNGSQLSTKSQPLRSARPTGDKMKLAASAWSAFKYNSNKNPQEGPPEPNRWVVQLATDATLHIEDWSSDAALSHSEAAATG